jgi:tyrosinase
MSGNGEYDPSYTGIVLGGNGIPEVPLPPGGSGGGCVYNGPFANMKVNLGPLAVYNVTPVEDSYTYNPRCIKRDLNPYVTRRWASWSNLTDLFDTENIDAFQNVMQGYRNSGEWGVHGGTNISPWCFRQAD